MYTLKAPFANYVVDVASNTVYTLADLFNKGKLVELKPVAKAVYRITVEGVRSRYTLENLLAQIDKVFVDKANFFQLSAPYHKYAVDLTTQKVYKVKSMKEVLPTNDLFRVKGIFGVNEDGSKKVVVANHDFEYLTYFIVK